MEADGYTAYTGIKIGQAFGVFIGLLLLQMFVMFFVKNKMSPRFSVAHWQTKVKHILESVNRPDYFVDWERGNGNEAQLKQRWKEVIGETSAMVVINFLFNLLLLVPLWFTSKMAFALLDDMYSVTQIDFLFLVKKVRERHLTIKPVIGVFREEIDAFDLITKLSWIIPLLLTIFSLLELVMVFVYQKYLHPWACIFAEENTNSQVSSCFSYISIFSNLFMIFLKPK